MDRITYGSLLTVALEPAQVLSFVSLSFRLIKTRNFSVSFYGPFHLSGRTCITNGKKDATTQISIWSNVEAGLGITAGCLVTLRPLFRWLGGTSYAATRSKRTAGSMPLSSMNGPGKHSQSEHTANSTKFWRPDLDPEDARGVITTVQTAQGSRNSSQEDLNPKPSAWNGVNVHKSFVVTSGEV